MGIRVRKLARELRTTPGDVLGLLQELGFERYTTAEDMVSDIVASKLRKARRATTNGHPHLMVANGTARPRNGSASRTEQATDLMAKLVPGVRRDTGGDDRHSPPPARSPRPPAAASAAPAAQSSERAALDAAKGELARARQALEAERAALEAERAAVEIARNQIEAERTALSEARAELESARAFSAESEQVPLAAESPSGLPSNPSEEREGVSSMLDMFDGRGLRGIDEAERALAALAGARTLGRLLEQVRVREPDVLQRLLWERLVLVGGPDVPEELDTPTVVVSQDRADIPGAVELTRRCSLFSEQLMLSGYTRVAMVGVARRWQPLLRARLDPRITLTFRPGPLAKADLVPSRDPRHLALAGSASAGSEPRAAAEPVDVVLTWSDQPLGDDVEQAVQGTRTRVWAISAVDLGGWLERATERLSSTGGVASAPRASPRCRSGTVTGYRGGCSGFLDRDPGRTYV